MLHTNPHDALPRAHRTADRDGQSVITKFNRVKATLLSVEFSTSKVLGEAQHLKCCFNTLNSVDVTLSKVNS